MTDKKIISIKNGHATKMLAIFAHLQNIISTATQHDESILLPKQMDHAKLLLASSSLRALFFDKNPILLSLLKDNEIDFNIECIETTLNLFLMSIFNVSDNHASDCLARILIDEKIKNEFPVDEKKQAFLFHEGRNVFDGIEDRPEIWKPTDEEDNEEINSGMSISNHSTPCQVFYLSRKNTSIFEWGNVPIGYLKDIRITRENIITFTANKLGGVHYDSSRLPLDSKEKNAFKILSTAYDWNNKSIMHAGLVAVGLACVELTKSRLLHGLMQSSADFYQKRLSNLCKLRLNSEDQNE